MKQLLAVIGILLPFLSACQPLTLKGKLINEQNEPVSGATIILKRTGFTTVSDREGAFIIANTSMFDTVIITATGYERVEEPSNERGLVTVILKRNSVALQEVTVSTGYQQLRRERATGSFAVVDSRALEPRLSPNLLERLDGIAPSLLFDRRRNSGEPLQLRGLSTLRSETAPLVVLDNFPYEGDIAAINPADVESVTVLRDAAAASVWGARAGNGVLVITTKKGRRYGPLRVSVSSVATVTERPRITAIPQVSVRGFIALESFLFGKGFYNSELSNATSRPALSPVVELLARGRAGLLSAAEAAAGVEALGRFDFRGEA
ncbi:MAG TPA: TonB-dependent receptor plug domain-containing protein, partial [Hymenobacter sp.]